MLSLTTTSLFLGGLAATVVPVLLHLLLQGKPKVIEFPAVMFILPLSAAPTSQSKRLRLC